MPEMDRKEIKIPNMILTQVTQVMSNLLTGSRVVLESIRCSRHAARIK